jgi:hypothetical protein
MEKIPEIRELTYHDLNVLLDAYRNLQPEDAPLPPRPEVERMWREILADRRLSYLGAFDGPRLLSTCNAVVGLIYEGQLLPGDLERKGRKNLFKDRLARISPGIRDGIGLTQMSRRPEGFGDSSSRPSLSLTRQPKTK